MVSRAWRAGSLAFALSGALVSLAAAQTPPPPRPANPGPTTTPAPPVPRPFPGSAGPPAGPASPAKPVSPPDLATAGQRVGPPTVDELAGAPIYPGAEFVDAFDAGQSQRYYLFGTNAPYSDIVLYYRNVLRGASNREIFRAPAMHQFDLGRFSEDSMAYPPSVVVKDYTWNDAAGYLMVTGTTEKRFKTIIQIVPK